MSKHANEKESKLFQIELLLGLKESGDFLTRLDHQTHFNLIII